CRAMARAQALSQGLPSASAAATATATLPESTSLTWSEARSAASSRLVAARTTAVSPASSTLACSPSKRRLSTAMPGRAADCAASGAPASTPVRYRMDHARGGRWRIAPAGPATSEQRYLPGTNILVTTFRVESGGVFVVTDFMPVGSSRDGRSEIHRRVQCTRGSADVEVEFEPRFDYGLHLPTIVRRAHGILATDRDNDVATVATDPAISWHIDEGRAIARFSLSAEQAAWFVHRFDDDEVHPAAGYRSQEKLEATAQWWDAW